MDLPITASAGRSVKGDGGYLGHSAMFVWLDPADCTVGEAVVDRSGEIKNMAVAPNSKNREWGGGY